MYFAIFCVILTLSAVQTGPLPKLRHHPPKWAKLEPIQIIQNSEEKDNYRKFDSIVHYLRFEESETPRDEEEEIRLLFGDKDVIYLTKKRDNLKHNNLLNIVEQMTEEVEDPTKYQEDREVMEVLLGLKRGLRRQGELSPKLVYEFNELVA